MNKPLLILTCFAIAFLTSCNKTRKVDLSQITNKWWRISCVERDTISHSSAITFFSSNVTGRFYFNSNGSYLDSSANLSFCGTNNFVSSGWGIIYNDSWKQWDYDNYKLMLEHHGVWEILEQKDGYLRIKSSLDGYKYIYKVVEE